MARCRGVKLSCCSSAVQASFGADFPLNVLKLLCSTACWQSDEFLMDKPTTVKENDQHRLYIRPTHACLLRSWRRWTNTFWWLCLCFSVIPIHSRFVICYDACHDVFVAVSRIKRVLANGGTVLLLVVCEQPWHKFFSNAVLVKFFSQYCVTGPDANLSSATSRIVKWRFARIKDRTALIV